MATLKMWEKLVIENAFKKCRRIQKLKDQELRISEQTLNTVRQLETRAANSKGKRQKAKLFKMVHLQSLKLVQSADKLVKLSDQYVEILADAQSKLERNKTNKPRPLRSAHKVVTRTHRTRSTTETGTTTAPGGGDNGDMDVCDPGSADEPEM